MAAPTIDQWNPDNGILTPTAEEQEREKQRDEDSLSQQVISFISSAGHFG